jgi:hypothetical protein
MRAAVIIAVAVSLLVAAGGPVLGRWLPPATATRLLTVASVLVAGCSVFVAGVLAFTWMGQLAPVAALGEWSVAQLRSADPIPTGIAVGCTALLVPAAGAGACSTRVRWSSWTTNGSTRSPPPSRPGGSW